MDVHVIPTDWATHREHLSAIRTKVFVEEQNVPAEEEWDVEDSVAHHFLAVNEMGQYIGCSRLLESGQVGRMAVLKEYRGFGVGEKLLQASIEKAQELGMPKLFLHAQTYAEPFYKRGGFVRSGSEFLEVGIPHVPMEMVLPIPFDGDLASFKKTSPAPSAETGRPRQKSRPMSDSAPKTFEESSDALRGLVDVADAADRQIRLLAPYLDRALFDQPALVDSISRLARSSARADVQILIMSSKYIVSQRHSLVDLARRLDDKIQIRLLDEEITEETSSFMCADLDSYWLIESHTNYNGVCDLYNPVVVNRFRESFQQAWDKSREDPELRLLRL